MDRNNYCSYSEILGATSSNYTFTPNDTATTGVWTFKVKVTDSDRTNVTSDFVSVTNGQMVPAPQVQAWPMSGNGTQGYSLVIGYPSWGNFKFVFFVRRYTDISSGLTMEYQGNTFSNVSGNLINFQFTLTSGTNWVYPHTYINCSGDIIPINLYDCSSFDMVTSNVTHVGNVPTFTNVITFHDIALQTYGNGASSITLVFTQHFKADWIKLTIETDTYADLSKMKLYYSNGSAVSNNANFSLNLDYRVGVGSQTEGEIFPTRVTETGLYYDVEGVGGMKYSLADVTLDDNYTEVQSNITIPNRTAIAYFSNSSILSPQKGAKELICSQRFTDLTYNVTTAVRSDPTFDIMHTQIPWSAPGGIPVIFIVGAAIGVVIVIVVSIVLLKKKKKREV